MTVAVRMRIAAANIGGGGITEPTEITGLKAWFDFSDGTTLFTDTGRTTLVSADGDPIKGVTDKSGQANHLSDSVGATYKTGIQNGHSIARFVAGSSQTLATATFGTALAQPNTLLVVLKVSDDTRYNTFWDGLASGHRNFCGHENNAGAHRAQWFAGSSIYSSADTPTTFACWAGLYSGASSQGWKNNSGIATGNAGADDLTGVRIARDTGTTFGSIEMAEFVVYSGDIGGTARTQLFDYFVAKWAI